MEQIYLDYAATTPVDPAVLNCMYDLEKNRFGNPSSIHAFGRKSRNIIENARKTVAGAIGAEPGEIVFTSGGTESDNMAILGAAAAFRGKGRHIVTTRVEHPAVLETCRHLEQSGCEVSFLEVDDQGMLSGGSLDRSVSADTILISVMLANNETGVLFPVPELRRDLPYKDILFHCDAVQAFGKVPIDVRSMGVDLLTLSAHKIYGPKGIGALYIRRGCRIGRHLFGGAQEAGRRPGTENIAAIGGFAEAVEQLSIKRSEQNRIRELRDRLESELTQRIPGSAVNGGRSPRLVTHSNLYFPQLSGDSLVMNLDLAGIAISTGSACSSGAARPSHVLTAMGLPPDRVASSVRISLGRFTTREEIDHTIGKITEIARRINDRVSHDS